jgi:selenocysteine-specific elongation factor
MRGALGKTKFIDAPILPISAVDPSIGTSSFEEALVQKVESMEFVRDTSRPFLMAIDHCFSKKGQGTVLTGTILQGRLKINDVCINNFQELCHVF